MWNFRHCLAFSSFKKAQSEQISRQRMLDRYHAGSPSPSYYDSWARSAAFSNSPKDVNDDRYVADLPPVTLPSAKVANVQYHPTAAMFHSYNPQAAYITQSHQRLIKKYNDIFRYNIPLQERFHQQEIKDIQEFRDIY
ncbi:unnamed protein product [Rotaria sp. Silwood2]|nr:unnamed protein product [Rotaria sp. Silwood2]CAF2737903.1 unnamed protein product [Rotaria sp. Silwood2]CAF3000595.1 unnamed protein product [Rotaria sp. Silwood2]CAF3151928.1 unnamed protein product [Rotaria sp. Silwood2]CAF3978616.1 unnamed protein product [Rotaria sp. Silwood2]